LDDRSSLLARVFTILGAFDASDVVLPLSELSRRTDLPKSTVHRITASLVRWGALTKTPTGFQLGMRLFELGGLVPLPSTIREAALPFMSDLYHATRETVHLGILDGPEVVYLNKIGGHRSLVVPSRVGGRMPAHCVGLGKAMLAFASPATIGRVMASGLPRRTPYTIRSPSLLIEALNTVRQRGVAYDREEAILGVCCVAAPVLDAKGAPIAAISLTGPSARLDPERLAPAVRMAAISLSRTLGRRVLTRAS
jgi:DNA-binding IclR family transcriptional regulator